MASSDERLSALLHKVVPEPEGSIQVETILRATRRRTVAATALVAAVTVSAGCVVALSVIGPPGHNPAERTPAGSQLPHTSKTLTYHGVSFVLPPQWRQVEPPLCGWPENETVALGDSSGADEARCPAHESPKTVPTSLRMTTMYGRQYLRVPGDAVNLTWQQQPAWLVEENRQGVPTVTLGLPWLNLTAAATAPDIAGARALLEQLRVPAPGGALDVPSTGSQIYLYQPGISSPEATRSITDPSTVSSLLNELRALPARTTEPTGCGSAWVPKMVLLTVTVPDSTEQTYAIRGGTCAEVTSGTGTAVQLSQPLRSALNALLPDADL